MKINFSAHSIAIASFAVIAITSWSGLTKLPKTEKGNLTSHEWALIITGSLSTISGFYLAKKESDDWNITDEKPDSPAEVSINHRESRSSDSHLQTHFFLNTSFDESIKIEVEKIAQQLSVVDVRDDRVTWSPRHNSEPPEEARWSADKVEQTPFCAFRCCSRCKFIDKYRSSCAVVPFGCCTGDLSEECREFEAKDDGNQGIEIDRPESEIVRVAMEAFE